MNQKAVDGGRRSRLSTRIAIEYIILKRAADVPERLRAGCRSLQLKNAMSAAGPNGKRSPMPVAAS